MRNIPALSRTQALVAGETAANLGRRLIEAQEQERTWLARELHDDINQQIAVIAIKVDRLRQNLSDATTEVRNEVADLHHRIFQLGQNIQGLSHRLHSSKLDYLGIAAAAHSFCEEMSAQYHVQIDFRQTGAPRKLPREISLCLFRVLQEALQNAVKHSGVREFRVELCATADDVQLRVKDEGAGFNPDEAATGRGLGLISMRERLQLANGHLSIHSQSGRGTIVSARVPFHAIDSSRPKTA